MKIFYAGTPGRGYGWGVCNTNLIKELVKLVELTDDPTESVIFMPLADHDFNPVRPERGAVNLAFTFFEFELGPNAAENAKKYDTVFAGSTWCLDRMRERGIENGSLLIQGVDRNIFKPRPARKPDGQFRIFSGGKFEYRKGQDLVIAAFKEFSRRQEEAHLVCSWFNPWPQLIEDSLPFMRDIKTNIRLNKQDWSFSGLLMQNDLCSHQFTAFPQFSQPVLGLAMATTDVGLFPNRCEGGTNLVMMEYACCGRKVIANAATGHADVAMAISYEIPATTDENHWAVQSVEDIVEMLELAYQNRETPEHWSMSAYRSAWTWEAAAHKIVDTANSALKFQQSLRPPRPSLIDLAST